MLRKILTAVALLLLFAFYSSAQIPSPLIFSRVTKKEGLASNTTFQTVRDRQGFLWIATQNGLQRYDGNRFLTFRHLPGNAFSIAENTINHLYVDKKGRLWLLFDKQIGIFNTTNFHFAEIKINATIGMIKKILEDGEGRIVMFADSKQFVFDEKKQAFASNYPLPSLPAGYTIGDMAVDPVTGLYWFTGKQGSLLYDPKTKKFNSKEQNLVKDPVLDTLGTLKNARYPFVAKDGSWWMVTWIPFTGTPPVLYNYDKKKNKFKQFEKIRAYKVDSYFEIWSIFQHSDETIWIYGMGLLAYYNTTENRFIHINSDPFQQNGIDYDYVSNLYEDSEKNVWVSTNKGLYRFNVDAQVFRNIPNYRSNDTAVVRNAVSAVTQMQDSSIWVSTWGAGIFSYDAKLQPIPNPVTDAAPLNKNLHASSMIRRRNGEVWIGLQTGDLQVYEPQSKKVFPVAHPSTNGEVIQQLFEDRQGNTWIGTNSGRFIKCKNGNWKDTSNAFTSVLSDISDIFKIYQDKEGYIWICTAGTGVYKINPASGRVLKQYTETGGKNDGLLNDGATDILQYDDSTFLIASDGLCILNSKTNQFRYLTAAEGLPSEHITALILDKKRRLWIACDGSLYRLNIDNKLYVTYDAADGITNNIFQVSSGTLLNDGRIAIGTPNNFLVFDPEKTIDKKDVPPVNITGFTLGTATLSVDSLLRTEKLQLRYDNTFLRFELSTLSFRDRFYMYYVLEGLDKVWKRVYNSEIIYQYLPPGKYTLKLKSQNGEGVESKQITALEIQVIPPFWKTWWFYSALVLLIGGLLLWLDHERIKRKTAILRMRSNIADDLHEDINAALSNITILSEMAKMKADREPEKSKEFIEQIHTKSRTMTLAMDDILWSIDPDNDSMENFILRFKEYVDALKTQHQVRIDVVSQNTSNGFQLKMKIRNDVFWIFKNMITETVNKGGKNVRIQITYEKPALNYNIEFETAEIDMSQMDKLVEGNELTARIKELNARLDLKKYKGKVAIMIMIPLRKDGL